MTIALQPEQEQFIQTQIATGRYTNATEVIAEALQLLEKRNQYDCWVEELRVKIDLAAAQLDRGEGIDSETAIALVEFDTHTRFKLLAAQGDRELGLKLLDKLDSLTD
ncbi:type II toxin-antitoxin system ParD family antitoxin [Tumidithrix elongata RA019]|uniref:Type II toxin-antitoxin system ParD family antitoxin n=1 Tax=Tumidithrix elongata BACA0141 TaxID=2716417 RepID=A0AAW9Q9Z9_9CYAN|nr:type II toxin-antitoxin system ParD family antitoxin [Tumidithrix elongata RA019]